MTSPPFQLEEATIDDLHAAIRAGRMGACALVPLLCNYLVF
jgi:hypothetical protein